MPSLKQNLCKISALLLFQLHFLNAVQPPLWESPPPKNSPVQSALEGSVLDIEQALELALKNNFEVRQARERLKERRAEIDEARASFFPTISLDGNYQRKDENLASTFGSASFQNLESWNTKLEAVQKIYSGGKNKATLKGKREEFSAAEAELQAVINDVTLQLKTSFYDTLLAMAEVEVQKEAVQLLEEEYISAKKRFRAGVGSSFEELRAKVAFANGKPDLIRAQNELKGSLEELRRVIGVSTLDPSLLDISGTLVFEPYEITMEEALARSRKNRPEIFQRQRLLQASEQEVKVQMSKRLPEFEIFANYGFERANSSAGPDVLEGWIIGVRGTWEVFNGLETDAQIAKARSELAQAQLGFEQLLLDIDIQVRKAYYDFADSIELVKASHEVIKEAVESLRLARSRFNVGATTQLDILDSQVALTEAGTNQALALRDYSVALAALKRAMGETDAVASLAETELFLFPVPQESKRRQ